MKFFAILRDSLREALDAKVIYFLFGLSGLVILLVASVSFQAEPGEKGLQSIIQRLPGGDSGFGQHPINYAIENFRQTSDTLYAYMGEYQYDLVVTENMPPEGKQEQGQPNDPEAKRAREEASPFKTLVIFMPLMTSKAEDLTEEQRQMKKDLGNIVIQVARSGGKPARDQMSKAAENLSRVIAAVTALQMEQFIQKQLAGAGALEANKVVLTENGGHRFRFQIECKARPDTVRTWPHQIVLFFEALTIPAKIGVGTVVYLIENNFVANFGASIAMLLATIITAFFIPNMLRKGTIDLLVSKPIHRWALLVSKYVGGLSFMFLTTLVIVIGIWLVLGIRSGLWGKGFLLSLFVLTFQFAIFYAFSTLIAVLTRSPIVCILSTIAFWALLWIISVALFFLRPLHELDQVPAWAFNSADIARRVLPRYHDLDTVNEQLIADDLLAKDSLERQAVQKKFDAINWPESLAVTVGYIALMLGLACWRFSVKDY